ncbi:MAG: T9SS type A sorting domain-containing protein [Candidatus Hydrothermales bacterium]
MKRLLLVALLGFNVYAFHKLAPQRKEFTIFKGPRAIYNQTIPEAWNWMSNFGFLGGEAAANLWGFTWPGGAAVNNYYLWLAYFLVGAKVRGEYYVTQADYTANEWNPQINFKDYLGPGKSVFDIVVVFNDAKSNPRNSPGRHLGVKVLWRVLTWPNDPYNDFIAYEMYITFDKDSSDIPGIGDQLDSFFVGMWYDCDVSGADASEPHIDDLVHFTGWTANEWRSDFRFPPYVDKVSFYGQEDGYIEFSDGIPDDYFIWGDHEMEHIRTCTACASKIPVRKPDGEYDTVIGYLIPYGMSYIYDADDPAVPGDDTGEEGGRSAGYNFGAFIYAPPSPSDSIWVVNGDTCRIIRPFSHQWWNWESDPGTDLDRYRYMKGKHPATQNYRYAPHPVDLNAAEFDYRFLNTVGPYTLKSGDTLKFVWIAGVGQGLNGGMDNYWGRGFLRGARQTLEWAYRAYYAGNPGDPAHPTPPKFDPTKDDHWKIPIPPPTPLLKYQLTKKGVLLVWDNSAETYVDPLKGVPDFLLYRVYRSVFEPRGFTLLAEIKRDQFGNISHTFIDTTAQVGFPYFYVVTAMDVDSLESPKTNYKKSPDGSAIPLYITTEPAEEGDLSKVRVVPNPFVGSAKWSATELYSKIEFQNLPPICKIYIFTASGKLVKLLNHNNLTGTEVWDLLNENNVKVSSGFYYYKIETPEGKTKIGKFVILD